MNIFDIFPPHVEERATFLAWEQADSDVDGCIELRQPMPLQCTLALSSPKIPVLCLIDELERREFVPCQKLVLHKQRSGKFYDNRNISKKRNYLQCVLAMRDIFAIGSI
jgi:hypothetical protein